MKQVKRYTSYQLFMEEKKAESGSNFLPDQSRFCSNLWKRVSLEEKEVYQQRARRINNVELSPPNIEQQVISMEEQLIQAPEKEIESQIPIQVQLQELSKQPIQKKPNTTQPQKGKENFKQVRFE